MKRALKLLCPLLLLLAPTAAANAAEATPITTFSVSQAHQLDAERPRLRAYLDVLGPGGKPLTDFTPDELAATLGENTLELAELEPMATSGDGVAYVFLVDISRSLSSAEFDRIVAALEAWIGALRPVDRAAIIAFGESSRLLVDFTADRERLTAALRSLGPTDDLTLLHRALLDAIELGRRRDQGLPGRRVLIVLTDGRDEGSGLTTEDVVAKLRSEPAPIYAIGYSRIRTPEARQRFLEVLNRFATVSGGAFFEADETGFGDAYSTIREAIERVWLAEFSCSACRADGREYRFQATLDRGGRVYTDGTSLRLLPTPKLRAVEPEPAAAAPPAEPPATEPATATPADTGASRPSRLPPLPAWWPWAVAGLALALLFLWAALRVRRNLARERTAGDGEGDEGEDEELEIEIVGQGIDPELPNPAAAPAPLRGIRLVVVRGSRAGRQYRFILQSRAVVGSRSTCDCVLVDEPNIAPEQFELLQYAGQIYIRDLSPSRTTLVDGLGIDERQVLKTDDLIGTGEIILRIVFD